MTFLIADGVVPSNEDRGYVLRRIMRRAILQGRHTLELEPGFLRRLRGGRDRADGVGVRRVRHEHGRRCADGSSSEEEGFGRTLAQGSRRLDELIARAKGSGAEGISGADAFMLHDTSASRST